MKSILAALSAILAYTSALPTDTYIYPTTLSLYEVSTGAVTYDVLTGNIFKDGHSSDVTTLLTFNFPDSTAGKMCEFNFALNNCLHCSPSYPTGTKQFDAYTSLAPADHSTTTWPSGNLRDQYVGRLLAVKPGLATGVQGLPSVAPFPCPAGKTYGGELVGAGDVVSIQWDGQGEGPYFRVY